MGRASVPACGSCPCRPTICMSLAIWLFVMAARASRPRAGPSCARRIGRSLGPSTVYNTGVAEYQKRLSRVFTNTTGL